MELARNKNCIQGLAAITTTLCSQGYLSFYALHTYVSKHFHMTLCLGGASPNVS
jgi:hypothetical protein